MKVIQPQNLTESEKNSPIVYYAILFILFGINHALNFLRPISNLFIIYFDLNWVEFQILELFDIFNLIFGIFLTLLGFFLLFDDELKKPLIKFGGITFFLYNIVNPCHFLIFESLFLLVTGNPPVWISVLPPNLLEIYLFSYSLISFSNILLQIIGFYIAIRITTNSNPKKFIVQFLFFYCWVTGISGGILCIQSILVINFIASWSSLTFLTFVFRLGTWISMMILGTAGLIFTRDWLQNRIQRRHIIFGRISLIAFAVMLLFISFSDFAMKTYLSLILNSLIAGILLIFTLKMPKFLRIEDKKEKDLSLP